ncbi:MAG: GNAT family N-acetyltransferase [Promethearchaeota archaeon]
MEKNNIEKGDLMFDNKNLRILDVKKDDLFNLVDIEKEIFKKDAFGVFILNEYLKNNLLFQKIINENGEILGFFILSELNQNETKYNFGIDDLEDKNCKIAHLDNIVLKKQYQHKKIGTYILKYILSILKKRGYSKLILEVSVANINAINFYLKNNFKQIDRIENYYSSRNDALIMICNI